MLAATEVGVSIPNVGGVNGGHSVSFEEVG